MTGPVLRAVVQARDCAGSLQTSAALVSTDSEFPIEGFELADEIGRRYIRIC